VKILDTITLNIIFEDAEGKRTSLKFKDIRADISSSEVSAFTKKIVDEGFLNIKGRSIVKFVSAEKITTEVLL